MSAFDWFAYIVLPGLLFLVGVPLLCLLPGMDEPRRDEPGGERPGSEEERPGPGILPAAA